MITDSLQDPWAEIRSLKDRIKRLETASPLENASISRGGIRALVPGNENGDGATKYGREGDRVGFLVKDGGKWTTIQEQTDKKIAASHEYPNARITDLEGRMGPAEAGITYTSNRVGDLEGRMGSAEAGITYTANRVGDVEGRMGSAEGRLGTAEGKIAAVPGQISASHEYPNARIGGLEGRMGSVEGGLTAKASAADLEDLRSDLQNLRNAFYNHGAGAPGHPPQKITG